MVGGDLVQEACAGSWWEDLAGTLAKVAAVDTDRVAVRQQYMDRAIPNSWASRPRP
ncbi:hypothetical protein ABT131_21640 [Streptomyces sp900105245]|uniref:hypothetical protein n=1 Tax=Streptomyces sp. 900105245 TaxID=3154379 RepID=UPI00332A9E4A